MSTAGNAVRREGASLGYSLEVLQSIGLTARTRGEASRATSVNTYDTFAVAENSGTLRRSFRLIENTGLRD